MEVKENFQRGSNYFTPRCWKTPFLLHALEGQHTQKHTRQTSTVPLLNFHYIAAKEIKFMNALKCNVIHCIEKAFLSWFYRKAVFMGVQHFYNTEGCKNYWILTKKDYY